MFIYFDIIKLNKINFSNKSNENGKSGENEPGHKFGRNNEKFNVKPSECERHSDPRDSSRDNVIKTTKSDSAIAAAAWNKAFNDHSKEIKVRHYSPKTLSAYLLWAKKIQGFTRNKNLDELSSADAKEYIKYLAVRKKVSASTQNQAFNSLSYVND